MIIWDGRPNTTSVFNDATIRQFIERKLIEVFKKSETFKPVNKVEYPPPLNYAQLSKSNSLLDEIQFMLDKQKLINPLVSEEIIQEEMTLKELEDLLTNKGYKVNDWNSRLETVEINGKKCFYRSGSNKPKGWQVTLKHDLKRFLDESDEDGYFLFNRGRCLLIPMNELRKEFRDLSKGKNTLDIFVVFENDKTKIKSHNKELDVSKFCLI